MRSFCLSDSSEYKLSFFKISVSGKRKPTTTCFNILANLEHFNLVCHEPQSLATKTSFWLVTQSLFPGRRDCVTSHNNYCAGGYLVTISVMPFIFACFFKYPVEVFYFPSSSFFVKVVKGSRKLNHR